MPKSESEITPPEVRLEDLIEDTWNGVGEEQVPWPHPDYAAAAEKCTEPEAAKKLFSLCQDLETLFQNTSGPGSLSRLAGLPRTQRAKLCGRCWREILCDQTLDRTQWNAIRNIGRALKAPSMDRVSRRTGAVIHAVAIARLEQMKAISTLRESHLSARALLLQRAYLPAFIARILKGA